MNKQMRRTVVGLLTCASLTALGAVQVKDQFTMSTGNLEGGGGGQGFAAVWDDQTATPNITVVANSLSNGAYSSRGLVPEGNKVKSPVGAGANLDWTASRQLSTAIDMNSGNTYYFSFLVAGSWANQAVKRGWNIGFSTVANALTSAITIKNGYNVSTLSYAIGGIETGYTTVGGFTSGQTLFIVGKMVTASSGNDNLSFSVYDNTETIPATESWDVLNNTVVSSASLGYFIINGRVNDPSSYYNFDEVRTGSSWDDVTQLPEPGMLLGASVLALAVLRRRG